MEEISKKCQLLRLKVDEQEISVRGRRSACFDLGGGPLRAPIRLGQPVTETISAPTQVSGPVAEGEPIGAVTLRQGDHVLGKRELVAAESAGGPGSWDRLRSGPGALLP